MPIISSYHELRDLSDEQLVELFDKSAPSTQIGVNFLRDELWRREADRQQAAMTALTKQMRNLTWVILLFTVISAAATAIALFR